MATIRTTTTTLLSRIAISPFRSAVVAVQKRVSPPPFFVNSAFYGSRNISYTGALCGAAIQFGSAGRRASARLSQVQQLLLDSEDRANESPPPKIRLEHVSVSFSKSGGPGHGANKEDPKVDMRFNVKNATWLSEKIRDKMLLLEKKRINKAGEIAFSSKKTRSQQDNIQDCLSKVQAIIDAAAYVPPPLSDELKKTIAELAAKSKEKRLLNKKVLSQKRQF